MFSCVLQPKDSMKERQMQRLGLQRPKDNPPLPKWANTESMETMALGDDADHGTSRGPRAHFLNQAHIFP